MARPQILQLCPLPQPLELPQFDIHPLWKQVDQQAFLTEHADRIEGVVTHVRFGCTGSLISSLPKLRVICNYGVGYEKIDVDEAIRRGVQVANTANVLSQCVADLAMGLVIDVARGISASDRFVRRGEWKHGRQQPQMLRVWGRKLGLLGFGGIGQAVAVRAAGFGMEVRYSTRRPVPGVPQLHVPDLQELAAWADVLVVACIGGPTTRHLVSADVLRALGPRGILVNIARGSIVDEAALVTALQNRTIFGAGLDAFQNEPHVPEELLGLDNVVTLSHIGGLTQETQADMGRLVAANLQAFFDTGSVLTPI